MDSTDKERIYKEGVAADPVELDGDAEYTDLDAKQMIQRVGDSMYSSPKSAFRELYVNALSHGIMQRSKAENIDLLTYDEAADDFPHVEVNIDVANRKLTIHDIAGQGISRDDFTDITQFIGHSGNFDRERPGKWGMGIFSFLKLSSVLHAHIYSASTGESYQKISQDGVKWTMPRQDGQSGRKKTVSKIDAVGGYRCKCGHPHSDMANKCTHPVNRVRPEKGICKCEKFEAEFIPVPADMKSAIEPDKPIQSGVKLTLVLKPEVKLTEMYRACKDIGTHWPVITRIQITEDIRKKQNVNKNSSIKGYGLSKGEDQEDVVQEACLERIGRHNVKDALWENVNSAEQSNINKDTISYVEKHIETDDFSLDVLVCRRPAASQAYGPSKKCPIFLLNVPIDVESYVRNAIPHEWIWHLNIKNEGNLSPTGDRDRLSEQACEILYDELRRVIGELFQDINDRLESHVIPARVEKFKKNKDAVEEERQIPENQNFEVAIKALNNDHLLVMNGDQSMETLTENGVVRTPLHEQYPDRLHQFHDSITQVCTAWLGNTNKEWKTKIGDVLTFPRVMSINNYSARQIEGVTDYNDIDNDWKPVTQWAGDKRGVDESYCAGDGIEEYRQDPNSIVFIRSPSHTASNQEYETQQAHFDMCSMMRATDFVKKYDVYVAPEPIKPKEDSQSVESSSYKPAVPISGIINVHSFPAHSVLSGKKHTIYKPAKNDTENIVSEFNNRNTVLVYDCTRQDLFGEDCPEPGQLIRMDNIRRWSYGVAVMNPIAGASNISFIKGTKALRELLPNARTINQFFLDIGNEKVRVVRKDVSIPKIIEESDDTELPIPTPEEIIPDKYQLVDMTIKELMTTLPLITERDYTSIRTNGINYAVDYYRVACPDSSLYLKQLGLPEDVKCDINDVLANDIDWGTVEHNGRHDSAYNQSFYVKTQPDQEIQATVKRNGVQVSYLPHILAENTELIAYLSYYLSAWAMSEYRSTPHMTHDTNLINKAYSITRRGKQTPYNKLIRWWGTLDPRLRKSLTNDDEMVPFRNWHHVWGEKGSANSGDIAVTGVNLTGMIPRCIKSIADYDRFVETVQEQILKVFPFMTACHRNTSLPKLIGPLKQTPIRTLNNTFASMRNAGGEPMGHIIWKYLNVEGTRDFADTSYQDEKSRDILLSFMEYMEMRPTLTAEVRYRPDQTSMSAILQKLSVSLHSQGIVDGSSSYDTKFTPVRKADKSGIVVDNKFSDDFQNIVGGDHSNILTQYINLWNITDGLMKFDKEVFIKTIKPIIKGDANWKFACTTQKLLALDKDKQWDQFLNGLVVTFDEVVNLVKNDVDVYSVQNPSDGQHKKPLAIVTNVGIKPHVFEVDQNGMDNMYDISISFASNSEFGFGGSERRLWSIDHDKYVFKTLQWKSFHVVEGALVLTGQLQLPFYADGVRHAGESLITDQEVMIE